MNHLPTLITDLALILAAAAVVTLLFKYLKQPIVLGYILAGFLVGSHFPFIPNVSDSKSVDVWAEIGVIVLLFSLGLEFSFKKLMRVGGSASITALTEVVVMLFLGYSVGQLLGWSSVNSIFLGGILSISSTTIIIRAFDELGVKDKKFAGLVYGGLIVQDLVAIVMMVLLPTVAVSSQLSGSELLFPVAKLIFFLVIWFVSGIFFLPTILRKAGNFMNDEMLLITSLALCLAMVLLTTSVGFSPALGAFVMGSILAETRVGHKIERLTQSVKDLFGAIFFVSVGMMIDPVTIVNYWQPILIISLVTVIGQPLSAMIGALLSGQPLKISVQAGMSFSQIGEFSFIIASLGLSLQIISPYLYPIAVAVSAITTFTTPYMIRASTPVYNWLERILPEKWKAAINHYSSGAQSIKSVSDWKRFVQSYATQVSIYTILTVGIVFAVSRYVLPLITTRNSNPYISIVATMLTLLAIAPLLWALAIRKIRPDASSRLWKHRIYKGPLVVMQLLRVTIAFIIVGYLIHSLISYYWAISALILVLVLIGLNYRRLQVVHNWIEGRFISNFHDKEKLEQKESGVHLTPWDAHITSYVITPEFSGIGQMLMELQLREKLGVNIAMIKRGSFTINAPDRQERIYPDDLLYIIGTDDQLTAFNQYMKENSAAVNQPKSEPEITLQRFEIPEGSRLSGKTIKESAVRERTRGLIVGIERGGERILNPESNMVLQDNDLLWIVGNKRRIQALEKNA